MSEADREMWEAGNKPAGSRLPIWTRLCASLLVGMLAFVASPSTADPEVVVSKTALGDGLFGYDVFIEFDDQLLLSAAVAEMTFTGNFRHIEVGEPGVVVDSDVLADFYQSLPEANYDLLRDSYFILSQFPTHEAPEGGELGSTEYVLPFGGTGMVSQLSQVHVAYLVLADDEGFSYAGLVGRGGEQFVIVPEPSAAACVAAAWLALAALRHRAKPFLRILSAG